MADCEELRRSIANYLIHNDNSDVKGLAKALEIIGLDKKEEVKDYILVNHDRYSQNKDVLSHFIVDNKFLDLSWEILLEDQSSKSLDISQIKIVVRISYMSVSELGKKELNLMFDENTFDVFIFFI
jgi:hypothetical protein